MYRGQNYYANPQYGWLTTTTDRDEYFSNVSRMEQTPSYDIPADHVPQYYPNLHMMSNNKVITSEKPAPMKHHNLKEDQRKVVRFVEQHKKIITDVDHSKNGEHDGVIDEESVDVEADGFIQQKHKNFEMCKWGTFKV